MGELIDQLKQINFKMQEALHLLKSKKEEDSKTINIVSYKAIWLQDNRPDSCYWRNV